MSNFQVWAVRLVQTGMSMNISPQGVCYYLFQIQNLIYIIYTEDDGVVTAQRTLPSAFPGFQQIYLQPYNSVNACAKLLI